MTLIEKFEKSTLPMDMRWRIYEKETRRKLSDDYGAEIAHKPYDDMEVYKVVVKQSKSGERYARATVYTKHY